MKNDSGEEVVEATTDETVKPSEYVKELLKEKVTLNPEEHSNAMRLIDQEVTKAQSQTGGKKPESRYVDIFKEKPIKVVTKVLVPVKEHPRFNFVGKLLGPKGNSLKRLQEETMTRMAILGRGSMRDKAKEEELRNALDPKYAHLSDELHVEIQCHAPPAEAYARIAYALTEIRKYLVPDVNDDIRQEQMREIQTFNPPPPPPPTIRGSGRGGGPPMRGMGRNANMGRGSGRPMVAPAAGRGAPPMGAPMPPRPMHGKAKVMSILDKARNVILAEESYSHGYDDGGYYEHAPPMGYASAYNGSGFYDGGGYGATGDDGGGSTRGGGWKSYGRPKVNDNPVGGKVMKTMNSRGFGKSRSGPYSRTSRK